MNEVVIAGAARTPMGGFQGEFAGVNASILGGVALKAALEDAQIASVDELYFEMYCPQVRDKHPHDRQVSPQVWVMMFQRPL